MKLYREVKASERLPGIPGWYIVYQNNDPFKVLKQVEYEGMPISGSGWVIKYTWIEPIEITEEEIEVELANAVDWGWIRRTKFSLETTAENVIPSLAKAILSKLKGE